MRIAIIGAGVSGLVAAYRLCSDHDVTVFEENEYAGGHTNTLQVELDGESHAIDAGFIVYNEATYPRFISLLEELGVPSQPTSMSFSVCDPQSRLEYGSHSLDALFAQRRNLVRPRFHLMLWNILRFNRHARRVVASQDNEMTVGEFLRAHRLSDAFAAHYLYPLGSAIWSCPRESFAKFPIRFLGEFFENHGLLNLWRRPIWRVIAGGARQYVSALTKGFRDRLRLHCPVERVRRLPDRVEVTLSSGTVERFDRVVFACHSDQALRLLGGDASPLERETLSAFPYQRNVAVLHTDVSQLPLNRRAWASWNYRVHLTDAATVTYNMNILQGIYSRHTFCVTLNDPGTIDPSKVLRTIEYAHPVFTLERTAAQSRHAELVNANRTSFCGAYWRNGFHEDGVVSALAVVDAIQASSRKQSMLCTAVL